MLKRYRSRLSAATCVETLIFGAFMLHPAGAASVTISGSATGTIGALGVPVPLPAPAAFAGTHDNVSGAMNVTLTSDDLSLALPLSGSTLALIARFTTPGSAFNPYGFSGNPSGDSANLDGHIRLTLTEREAQATDLPSTLRRASNDPHTNQTDAHAARAVSGSPAYTG